ncbi:hypothetical protein HBI49_162380 [Parastagonospora nodorum]|nr:hypothetical protein HBI49_162380 [Parastagonospora nodorum]
MRLISTNNDLLRHKQQQRLPILRQDSICNAITLISDKYKTLYAELRYNRIARCKVQRLIVAYRRKMQYNYNPKTRLQNNNRYAKAVVYKYKDISSLNYIQFIRTLEREVEFEDKRSSIYYYTKTADSWTYIQISTEAR